MLFLTKQKHDKNSDTYLIIVRLNFSEIHIFEANTVNTQIIVKQCGNFASDYNMSHTVTGLRGGLVNLAIY